MSYRDWSVAGIYIIAENVQEFFFFGPNFIFVVYYARKLANQISSQLVAWFVGLVWVIFAK